MAAPHVVATLILYPATVRGLVVQPGGDPAEDYG